MAVENKQLISGNYIGTTLAAYYTAPAGTTTVIDKFSVVNSSSSNQKFSAHIVVSGGSATNQNIIIVNRTVKPGEADLCPELVGRVLETGSFISMVASAVSALTAVASGREVTSTSA